MTGDSAMLQVASIFSKLADSASRASKSLDLNDEKAAALAKNFASFTIASTASAIAATAGVAVKTGQMLANSFSWLGGKAKDTGKKLVDSTKDVGKNISESIGKDPRMNVLKEGFAELGRKAKWILDPLQSPITKLTAVMNGLWAATKFAMVGLAKMSVSGPKVAWDGVTGAFGKIAATVTGFVAALNPGIAEQLQLAFDDLAAVVGRMLLPVMGATIAIVRTFADAMVPVTNALAPAFGVLAEAMLKIAGPIINAFSAVLVTAAPIVEQVALALSEAAGQIGQELVPLVQSMVPWFAALAETFVTLVPAATALAVGLIQFVNPVVATVTGVLIPVIKLLASTIGWLAKKIGWLLGKAGEGLGMIAPKVADNDPLKLKAPKIDPGASRGMAGKGATYMGFADFGSRIQEAAFGSSIMTPELRAAQAAEKLLEFMKGKEEMEKQNAANLQKIAEKEAAAGAWIAGDFMVGGGNGDFGQGRQGVR